jgi:tetratricopeptide (TPR) repeat protein
MLHTAKERDVTCLGRNNDRYEGQHQKKTSYVSHFGNYNRTHWVNIRMIGRYFFRFAPVVLSLLCCRAVAVAQIDEARQAIERGEFPRAVSILSDALADRPTADTYVYLGIAYANMKEYDRAQDVLVEGSERFPSDPRFHNELAGIHLAKNDVEAAKSSLRRALEIDPVNSYASDLLATIDMSEGNVQGALRFWNRSGRPVIDDILHNYYLNFGSWVVPKATAFRPSDVLRYGAWKTTETRLLQTENFINVALEVEPTIVPDRYNAVIRTTPKTNTPGNIIFGLLKGAPVESTYLDLWNLGNSGVNFNALYRWNPNHRLLGGHLKIPLPVPGLLFMDILETWRSEQWDAAAVILPQDLPESRFRYKGTGVRLNLKHIPDYRFEIGGGYEYVNRAASGDLPQVFTDSQNTGRVIAETTLRFARGRYQNRLLLEAFAARKAFLSDLHYTGGVGELNNRVALTEDARTHIDITLKGGSVRGQLPFEDYFVLGLELYPRNILRGHAAISDGRYGHAPMGTDFGLINFDVEHRIATVPMFNTFNLPYLTIKSEIFFDAAKTFDRADVFQQGKLLLDTGVGLRLETPTNALTFVLGRSLRDGTGVFMGYIERRLW